MVFSESHLYLCATCCVIIGFLLLIIFSLTSSALPVESSLDDVPSDLVVSFTATISDIQQYPDSGSRIVFVRSLEESGFMDASLNTSLISEDVLITGMRSDEYFSISSIELLS